MSNNRKFLKMLELASIYAYELRDYLRRERKGTVDLEKHIDGITELYKELRLETQLASGEQAEHSAQSAHARNQMHELKDNLDRLEHAVTELRVELTRATACLMSHAGATKNDIDKLGCKIMSAISDWKTKLDLTFDEIDTKLDTANTKLTGLTDDVAFLKETIEKLQTNPGPITPEDQTLLDAAQARVNSLSAKAAAVSTALEALDAATERPVAPPLPA